MISEKASQKALIIKIGFIDAAHVLFEGVFFVVFWVLNLIKFTL